MSKSKERTVSFESNTNLRDTLERKNIEYLDIDKNTVVAIALGTVYKIKYNGGNIRIEMVEKIHNSEKIDDFISLIEETIS